VICVDVFVFPLIGLRQADWVSFAEVWNPISIAENAANTANYFEAVVVWDIGDENVGAVIRSRVSFAPRESIECPVDPSW
jgi:hypothetical protein